ncbi:MAG: SRPBCC family protein [Actinobacteria bacterium]|nr:SRPBCC family protein [Actinomycetota bacterium]
MGDRAEIVETGSRWAKSARIVIDAPAQRIFDVLADPAAHAMFDGSDTLQGLVSGPDRLFLGAHFGMGMRIRLPYRTDNTVVEFEDGRLIAWCHFYRHRWRYELEQLDDGSRTSVTETFDGRTSLFPPGLLLINALANNQVAVAKSLVRLKHVVETAQVAP